MKPIDAIRLQLKAMEMVEGTELDWWEVLRDKNTKAKFSEETALANYNVNYELALGVIEGKPVCEGDTYHDPKGFECMADKQWGFVKDYWERCTWLPPTPKTAMVELLVEDIKAWSDPRGTYWYGNLAEACRKTLSELK